MFLECVTGGALLENVKIDPSRICRIRTHINGHWEDSCLCVRIFTHKVLTIENCYNATHSIRKQDLLVVKWNKPIVEGSRSQNPKNFLSVVHIETLELTNGTVLAIFTLGKHARRVNYYQLGHVEPQIGEKCNGIGVGSSDPNRFLSNVLYVTEFEIVPIAICRNKSILGNTCGKMNGGPEPVTISSVSGPLICHRKFAALAVYAPRKPREGPLIGFESFAKPLPDILELLLEHGSSENYSKCPWILIISIMIACKL